MITQYVPFSTVKTLNEIQRVHMFFTKWEAMKFARTIGWPKSSARLLMLPYGRNRWVVSDQHGNVVCHDESKEDN